VINSCVFGGIPNSPPAARNLALRRRQKRYIPPTKSNALRIAPMVIPPIAPFDRLLGSAVVLVALLVLLVVPLVVLVVPLVVLVVGVIVAEFDVGVILRRRKISVSVVSQAMGIPAQSTSALTPKEEPGPTEAYVVVMTFVLIPSNPVEISNWVMAAVIGAFIPKFPSHMYGPYSVTAENPLVIC